MMGFDAESFDRILVNFFGPMFSGHTPFIRQRRRYVWGSHRGKYRLSFTPITLLTKPTHQILIAKKKYSHTTHNSR